MLTFLTGFAASVAHVVTGPDHLAAVTPLAIDSRKKSWIVGFSWGLGHTTGMLLLGLLFILFRSVLPFDAISRHSDTVIGVLLIAIGLWAMMRIYMRHSHGHGHDHPHSHFHHGPYLYAHIHRHEHDESGGHDHVHEHTAPVRRNALTAMGIGIIHGFAGFSHLFALLPSLALPTRYATVIYIAAFAVGTILAMLVFAFILGHIAAGAENRSHEKFLRNLTFGGGLLAILVGILWLVHPF
jgi:ABC-type nickel/cobalt efflux system permease component RcnA